MPTKTKKPSKKVSKPKMSTRQYLATKLKEILDSGYDRAMQLDDLVYDYQAAMEPGDALMLFSARAVIEDGLTIVDHISEHYPIAKSSRVKRGQHLPKLARK